MRFIDKSAREYDNGDEVEARRIAGQLQILLVDRGQTEPPHIGGRAPSREVPWGREYVVR